MVDEVGPTCVVVIRKTQLQIKLDTRNVFLCFSNIYCLLLTCSSNLLLYCINLVTAAGPTW